MSGMSLAGLGSQAAGSIPPVVPSHGVTVDGQPYRVCATDEICDAPPVRAWGSEPVGSDYRTTWDAVGARLGTQNPIKIIAEIERQLAADGATTRESTTQWGADPLDATDPNSLTYSPLIAELRSLRPVVTANGCFIHQIAASRAGPVQQWMSGDGTTFTGTPGQFEDHQSRQAVDAQNAMIDRYRSSTGGAVMSGVAGMLGASAKTQEAYLQLGTAIDGFGAPSVVGSRRTVVTGRSRAGAAMPNAAATVVTRLKPTAPDLLTSHPQAHSIARHGGQVTDAHLMTRARTGLTPDGHQGLIPRLSTAFHSNDILRYVDQVIRNDGALQRAIAAAPPGTARVVVTPDHVGDLGMSVGRGHERVGKNPTLHGPLYLASDLRSAQGVYVKNPTSGAWETLTLFPAAAK